MNLYHLRRYRREDRTACLLLFEGNIPGSFFPFEIPKFLEFLDCFNGPYLVVEETDGKLIACGGLGESEEAATLCWGMVACDRQRQGIGRFLLRARLSLAMSNPLIRVINLNTTHLTAPFFAREGFLTRNVFLNSYGLGLHRHDMELRLDAAQREKIGGYLTAWQVAGQRVETVGHDPNRDRIQS